MILEIKNGCFGYPKQDIILADINLSLEEGHILAILGPNGIGKTTLLKCMIGLLPWREGATFLYGQDIKTLKPKELWSNVSYIPQSHGFAFSYTGLEMVMLGRCSHLGVFEQPGRREIEMAEAMMEKTGITQEALALADRDIIIPMIGMVQSLNVSVASALILYEAQRQRQNAGMYLRENSMLPEAEQQRLLFEGGYPVLAKVAKRKGLPYPHVNQQGEIEADADWWATMQAAG